MGMNAGLKVNSYQMFILNSLLIKWNYQSPVVNGPCYSKPIFTETESKYSTWWVHVLGFCVLQFDLGFESNPLISLGGLEALFWYILVWVLKMCEFHLARLVHNAPLHLRSPLWTDLKNELNITLCTIGVLIFIKRPSIIQNSLLTLFLKIINSKIMQHFVWQCTVGVVNKKDGTIKPKTEPTWSFRIK